VDYFVRAAQDGATRCCDGDAAAEDMSECRCPKKETPPFQNQIDGWCKDIATCPKKKSEEDTVLGGADGNVATASE